RPEHAIILGVFGAIGVTGFFAEAFRLAEARAAGGDISFEKWSFIGYPMSTLFNGVAGGTLNTWHQIMWIAHVVVFVAFLAILPVTMLRHMFTSPLNMYLRDKE